MSLVQDLWNGYVLQESIRVQRRLGVTQTQQQAYQVPPTPSNVQALPGTPGSTAGFVLDTRTMVIGGGLLTAAVVVYLVLK